MTSFEDEREQLETELREALREAGLDWLLAQVDRTIAEGRAVVVAGPRREQMPFTGEFDARDREVTAEPFSVGERVELLLSALERTLVQAPALAEETQRLLVVDGEAASVSFADPATGDVVRVLPDAAHRDAAREAAGRLSNLVEQIRGRAGQ
jgi:hypothetical protein